MALHQALWLGLMVPDSNISFKWFLTSSTIGGGIHLYCSLKGVSSVTFIICSVEWAQPNSAGSNENMSWYLARSWWAASTNFGVHESRPLRSNLSNNLPCLCLSVQEWGSYGIHQPFLPIFHPWGFRHRQCNYCPGHRCFLLKGLWVGGIVLYHHNCFFYCLSLTWYKCSV